MDKHKQVFTVVLVCMIALLVGCHRGAGGSLELKGTFSPFDLALACDESTPFPLRSEYPARDGANADGNVCVERNSGANSLNISKIEICKDPAFREPVYEIQFHMDRNDQARMERSMTKAMQPHRTLVYVVRGAVVARAVVTGLPENGVVSMGGYESVAEAEVVAKRFEVPVPRSGQGRD